MNGILATLVGGLLTILGGALATFYTQWRTHRRQREQNFFDALGRLTGGSQERNVGVAVMEWYWKDKAFREDERLMDLSVTLLSNSAMYLLEESRQGDATHEKDNLARIMNLLMSVASEKDAYGTRFAKLRTSLSKALVRRQREETEQQGETTNPPKKAKKEGKGPLEVDIGDLERWLDHLA